VIEALNLCKRFRTRSAVKCARWTREFHLQPGEIYGLLARMVRGKPRRFECWQRFLEPTEGTARLCGHILLEHPERVRENCGFLSTATALYPRLNGAGNGGIFRKAERLDSATLKKRIDEIFDRLDMNDFRDRRCEQAFHRDETEDFDRANASARSTSDDF